MRSVPAVGGDTQPIIRIVELLPAPFGPRKPNASPRCTSKSTPSTAVSSPNCFTSPRAWINGAPALILRRLAAPALELRGGALERFGELRELVLVGEAELDASTSDLRVKAGELLECRTHAARELGIDRRRLHAWLLLRARPLRPLLRSAHGETLLHDLTCKPAAAFVIGHRKHR